MEECRLKMTAWLLCFFICLFLRVWEGGGSGWARNSICACVHVRAVCVQALWVVEVIKSGICGMFSAGNENCSSSKPHAPTWHISHSNTVLFLFPHAFPNYFQKARKEDMKGELSGEAPKRTSGLTHPLPTDLILSPPQPLLPSPCFFRSIIIITFSYLLSVRAW